MKQVLTIAGLDSLAGGGATADIKTFEEFNTFGHIGAHLCRSHQ